MVRITIAVLICASILLHNDTGARADETAVELPSPTQIVEYHQELAAEWMTIPRFVLLTFATAQDHYYFERPPYYSTITREIGDWLTITNSGMFSRLVERMAITYMIGESLTHDEILNWYVNQSYMGSACYGVASAAAAYFGKTVDELSLEEVAYLAALPTNPTRPFYRAIERRNFVLSEMLRAGLISNDEAEEAMQTDLIVREPLERCEFEH